jgi:antitoxin component of MazEF toxin-antitoxin module
MQTLEIKLTRIGNSRGVRLPAHLIHHYGLAAGLAMEVRDDGLLLKPTRPEKLSWAETAGAMAGSAEDWADWEGMASDGLEDLAWDDQPAAKSKIAHPVSTPKKSSSPAKRLT